MQIRKNKMNKEDIQLIDLDIDVPEWIDQEIDYGTVLAVNQGGCASGAYMPAVTYYNALKTMNTYGDDVIEYIEEIGIDLGADFIGQSWSGMACYLLSAAVELWCSSIVDEVEEKIEEEAQESKERADELKYEMESGK